MSEELPEPRAISHALFNNASFAQVVSSSDTILETGGDAATVTTRQVAAAIGASDSVVRPVMQRLVAAGLLDRLPKTGPANGTQLYVRRNNDRWRALLALIEESTGLPSTRSRS